jgi:hypothetical protein
MIVTIYYYNSKVKMTAAWLRWDYSLSVREVAKRSRRYGASVRPVGTCGKDIQIQSSPGKSNADPEGFTISPGRCITKN